MGVVLVLARDHQLFGKPEGYAGHDVAAGHQQHRLLEPHSLAEVCHACARVLPSPPPSPQAGRMHVAPVLWSPSERGETLHVAIRRVSRRGQAGEVSPRGPQLPRKLRMHRWMAEAVLPRLGGLTSLTWAPTTAALA